MRTRAQARRAAGFCKLWTGKPRGAARGLGAGRRHGARQRVCGHARAGRRADALRLRRTGAGPGARAPRLPGCPGADAGAQAARGAQRRQRTRSRAHRARAARPPNPPRRPMAPLASTSCRSSGCAADEPAPPGPACPMNLRGYFIAGTDTGVGKTRVTVGLLDAFAGTGERALGMKAVASGTDAAGRNEDVALIQAANARSFAAGTGTAQADVAAAAAAAANPYCFEWPIS